MQYRVLKLSLLSCSYCLTLPVHADLIETPTSTNRLEQLSRAVAQGSYSTDSNDVDEAEVIPKLPTWFVNCHKKKFDNMKICSMSLGDLWVFLINGKYSVSVGSDHYPRSKGGLRIDNSPAIYGYEGELPKPLSIIERLKKGKVAYTRYQEWPNQYNTDDEVSLKEFNQYFNQMLSEYKKL